MTKSLEPRAFEHYEARDCEISAAVDATAKYTVFITNNDGRVLFGGTTTGVVGAVDSVRLYLSPPNPSNPNSPAAVSLFFVKDLVALQTGLAYGPGYYAAYWTYDYRRNQDKLLVVAGPT